MNANAGTAGVLACLVPSTYLVGTQQARTPAVPALARPIPQSNY